jgi:hypothetical protein
MPGSRSLHAFVVALLPAAAVAIGNYAVARMLVAPAPVDCLPCVAWLVGAPLLLGVILAATLPRLGRSAAVVSRAAPAPCPPPPPVVAPEDGALRLLGALQEEGRFVDFVQEDLGPYSDEQIGAAVRGIQEGCRKALAGRITIEPVLRGAEGEAVTLERGFDPAEVRLTGNVVGEPPFRGVLRHPGWRVITATLPERRGQDPHVLAPAEVELG